MNLKRIALLGLGLLVAACSDTDPGTSASTRTRVLLTDSPFPFNMMSRVDVHIVRLDATTSLDTTNQSGTNWVTVIEPRRTVNLLDFQGGAATLLGEVDLPAGEYRAVRLVIDTRLSSMTAIDGSHPTVNWQVNGELTLYAYVQDPLAVSANGASIVIDFDVGRSFLQVGNGFVLLPWIRAVNSASTGTLQGTVLFGGTPVAPFENAVISVYRQHLPPYGGLMGTGRTDAQGHYTIAYLSPGTYALTMELPADIEGHDGPCVQVLDVSVGTGQTVTVDRTIPFDAPSCGGTGTEPDTTGTGGPDTTGTTVGGPVATVTVEAWPAAPVVGDSAYAIAHLFNATGGVLSNRQVTWTVSDSAIARIGGAFGQYLNFWALAPGSVTLTATSEGKSGSATVTVQ